MAFLLMFTTPILATDPVQRLNYGIVFKPSHQINFATEYWVHTYEVKLPVVPTIPHLNPCTVGNDTCTLTNQIQTHLNLIKTKCIFFINETNNQIIRLIPQATLSIPSRTKRGILNFVGSFAKTLFGTATVDDVNLLAKHINALTKHDISIVNTLKQHAQHLSSFMKLVDTRFHNALNAVKINHNAIENLSLTLGQDLQSFRTTFLSLTALLTDQIQQASTVEHQLTQLKTGITQLIQGKLSSFLISPHILQQTIHHLSMLLSDNYPGFTLIHTQPTYYYSEAKVLFTRTHSHIYIAVKFPLSSTPQPLQVYQVLALPIPINDTSNHSTMLLDLPSHFAVSHDKLHYTSFHSSILSQCTGQLRLHCPFRIPLTPVTVPSCLHSLFQDKRADIKQHCDYRYLTQPKPPQLISLDSAHVLVYRIPFLTLTCPDTHRMIAGCTFCLLKPPCFCTLSTEDLFYPASFSSCPKKTDQVTRLHPVNLALLQHFFDDTVLSTIAGDTHFRRSIDIKIPPFHLYTHKFASILAKDTKAHLSLKRMAESAKKDQMIFQSLSEPILDGQISIPSSWFDTSSVIAIVSSSISAISILLAIWIFFKIRTLSAAIMLMTHAAPVKSILPPAFDYNQYTSTTQSTPTFVITSLVDYHVSILLGFITVLLLILLILLAVQLHTNKCNGLVLELTTGPECVTIPIMSLTLCPAYWDINPPAAIDNLQVSGTIFPSLTLDWPEFLLTNKLTNRSIHVPTTIRISYLAARKLRRMFRQPFTAYVLIAHQGLFRVIDPK